MLQCERTIQAQPSEVWKVWTDVPNWPRWDPSKEIVRMDVPFAVGASGWAKQRGNLGGTFTITAVEPEKRWTSECPVPLGKIVFDHLIEPRAEGGVTVTKTVEVHGGFAPLFRVMLAAKMRADIARSFTVLEQYVLETYGRTP